MPKTACCGGPCNGSNQGVWTSYSVQLPASANENSSIQIGFNWTNNDDDDATDPSFAVDNVSIQGTSVVVGNDCPCDFNNDGLINAEDLLMYIAAPSGACEPPCTFDLNNDQMVNSNDLLTFLGHFGLTCD